MPSIVRLAELVVLFSALHRCAAAFAVGSVGTALFSLKSHQVGLKMGAFQSSESERDPIHGSVVQLGPLPPPASREDVELVADAIAKRVKAVAFDMDQCLVAQHSRGCMRKVSFEQMLTGRNACIHKANVLGAETCP